MNKEILVVILNPNSNYQKDEQEKKFNRDQQRFMENMLRFITSEPINIISLHLQITFVCIKFATIDYPQSIQK